MLPIQRGPNKLEAVISHPSLRRMLARRRGVQQRSRPARLQAAAHILDDAIGRERGILAPDDRAANDEVIGTIGDRLWSPSALPATLTPGVTTSKPSAPEARRISFGLSCGAAMIPSQPQAQVARARAMISSARLPPYPSSRSPVVSRLVSTGTTRILRSLPALPSAAASMISLSPWTGTKLTPRSAARATPC